MIMNDKVGLPGTVVIWLQTFEEKHLSVICLLCSEAVPPCFRQWALGE